MKIKNGFAHVLLLVIMLAATALLLYFLVSSGKLNIPGLTKKPNVELKTEYKNPFDRETQYVNPFQEYKNPFNNI